MGAPKHKLFFAYWLIQDFLRQFSYIIVILELTDTQQIITLNLPHGKTSFDFAALVKICLGVSFFFTYPLMLFPVTHLIDKTFGFHNDHTKGVRCFVLLMKRIGALDHLKESRPRVM